MAGTVSDDGAKRCQKAKVTLQIPLTSSENPMGHPWGQLNLNGLSMINLIIMSGPTSL